MQTLMISWISVIVAVCSLSILVITGPARIESLKNSRDIFTPPPLSGLSTNMIRILSLGHKYVYDDFINIWLLQSLMEPNKPQEPDRMMNAIRAVMRHQPEYETLYMLSCFVMIQDFGRPDYCQEISMEGLKVFPNSWRLPIQQGYVHAFLTKEPAQAAGFFLMASSRPDAPDWLKGVIAKLLSNPDISEQDLTQSLSIIESYSDQTGFGELIKRFKGLISDSKK